MKKVFKYIYNTILFIFIGVLIWFICNYKMYIVISGSMEPTIKTNELVVVKTKLDHYEVGDIVSYYENGYDTPITHRIIDYNENDGYYITKGDNNNVADSTKLYAKNIIGKVTYQSYDLGYIIMKYGNVIFLSFGIVIFICLLILLINLILRKRIACKSDSFLYMKGGDEDEAKKS